MSTQTQVERKADQIQKCWCQEDWQTTSWHPLAVVPSTTGTMQLKWEGKTGGPTSWEPKVTRALSPPHPTQSTRQEVFLMEREREKDCMPDSNARVSYCLPVSCLFHRPPSATLGCQNKQCVLSLERFHVPLCGGVQLIRSKNKSALNSIVWKCSTSYSDISLLSP